MLHRLRNPTLVALHLELALRVRPQSGMSRPATVQAWVDALRPELPTLSVQELRDIVTDTELVTSSLAAFAAGAYEQDAYEIATKDEPNVQYASTFQEAIQVAERHARSEHQKFLIKKLLAIVSVSASIELFN
jgi:hypothetical protein